MSAVVKLLSTFVTGLAMRFCKTTLSIAPALTKPLRRHGTLLVLLTAIITEENNLIRTHGLCKIVNGFNCIILFVCVCVPDFRDESNVFRSLGRNVSTSTSIDFYYSGQFAGFTVKL